jgi:hypothetical protein
MELNQDVHAASRNLFIDGLPDGGFEPGQITGQIHHDVTLLPINGIEFDAEFRSVVIGLAAAITSHASH